MTIGWDDPPSSGGFAVLAFRIFVDNNLLIEVDPSQNTHLITGLNPGTQYKIQVSSRNDISQLPKPLWDSQDQKLLEVAESERSPAARITFANRPSAPASLILTSAALPSIEASWTAPAQTNGGSIAGYKLYIDNAAGGQDRVVFDGSKDQPATYSHVITTNITCGALYILKVTAVNVAGESDPNIQQVKVGEPPSPPLHPARTAIIAHTIATGTEPATLSIAWSDPLQDGCLPVLYYVVNRNAADVPSGALDDEGNAIPLQIMPSSNSYTDDISDAAEYPLGATITYKIRAYNHAGPSPYSVPLVVTVGVPPSAPSFPANI